MVLTPLIALLKSRKFMVALLTLLFNLLILAIPTLAVYRAELILPALALGMTMIYGISKEDAAKLSGSIINPSPLAIEEQVKNVLNIALDEILKSGGSIRETSITSINPGTAADQPVVTVQPSVSATPATDPAIIGESAGKREFRSGINRLDRT